jgi:Flp pilus assembly protein TadD
VNSKSGALILVIAVAAAALLRAAETSPSTTRPLRREQVLTLVQNAVTSARLAELVKQRGIDFEPTEEYLATLQRAGAEPVLLNVLRAAMAIPAKTGQTLTADAPAGSRSITVNELPAGVAAGSWIELSDRSLGTPQGEQFNRETVRVDSISGSRPYTIHLATSVDNSYQVARSAQVAIVPPVADSPQTHLEAGRMLLAQNRPDEAVAEFRQASYLQPDSAETHRALTMALFDKGDLDGATAEYRQAIRLEPEDGGAHVNLGLALYVKDDLEGAIAEYREAVRLNPKDPNNHFLLGNALAKKPDLEACIAELLEAVRLRPDFAEAHDDLGSALEQHKDLRLALEQYQIARGLEPHNLDYQFHYEHLSHLLGAEGPSGTHLR